MRPSGEYFVKWITPSRKSPCTPQKWSVPDVQSKREAWNANIVGIKTDNLIFLDESGVNTDMTRIYGRAPSNQRVTNSAPLITPITTAILASIRTNGQIPYDTYQGGTTATRFKEYLEHILLPTLKTDDVIVMDNMRSHHAKIVCHLLDTKKSSTFIYCHTILI